MKKKVLAIVLVAVLCVGMLAGCGEDPLPEAPTFPAIPLS